MRQRCYNKSDEKFPIYGGRGIVVSERWKDFQNFLDDMGERPSSHHSLDRIDTNGNYEPGNCRWATQTEQQRNRRNNRLITYNGQTKCVREWEDFLGFHVGTLQARLLHGWTVEDAFTRPIRPW